MSETRTVAVTETNPHTCTPDHECEHHDAEHEHGEGCGHEAVQHGGHVDYVVGGHLITRTVTTAITTGRSKPPDPDKTLDPLRRWSLSCAAGAFEGTLRRAARQPRRGMLWRRGRGRAAGGLRGPDTGEQAVSFARADRAAARPGLGALYILTPGSRGAARVRESLGGHPIQAFRSLGDTIALFTALAVGMLVAEAAVGARPRAGDA